MIYICSFGVLLDPSELEYSTPHQRIIFTLLLEDHLMHLAAQINCTKQYFLGRAIL